MADNSNKKYSGKTAHPLAKLKKRADVTVKELLAKLAIAEANIMTAIVRCQNPAYAKNQRDLYNKIRESYFKLCRQIDQALKSDVASAATDAYHQLADELGSDGLVRWDEERAKRYWQYVAPEQSQSLAAVYTDKMAESAITSLRQALIETERQASIEGWTMNEKQKALQAKWASLASRADFQFVDKAGKGWEHARYLQMLTRTTAQRVYNDSYLDRVAENGIKLVRVTALGAPECEVCRAWQGVICSIDGTARGLPSIEAAKSAGVFHPNCVCIHEAVIEEVDKTELAIQRKHPFTKDIRDLDAYEARKFAIDQERYERKGLSAEDARIAVNRDNLELAIRNGLIRSDAREIVDGLTDTQVAALCPDGKTPRFEPVKTSSKNADEKIIFGKHGHVIHVSKDATISDFLITLGFSKKVVSKIEKYKTELLIPTLKTSKQCAEYIEKQFGISCKGFDDFPIDFTQNLVEAVADMNARIGSSDKLQGIWTFKEHYNKAFEIKRTKIAEFMAKYHETTLDDPNIQPLIDKNTKDFLRKKKITASTKDYGKAMFDYSIEGINGIVLNNQLHKMDRTHEVELKYKPQGCEESWATIYHEFGHILDYHFGIIGEVGGVYVINNPTILDIWGRGRNYIANNLSEYGSTSPREMIAEAWAEYKMNPKPRKIALTIGKEIDSICKGVSL